MNILLTGGGGFIGSNLTVLLSKFGEIYTIGRDSLNIDNHKQINFNNSYEINDYVEKAPSFEVLVFLVGLAHNKGNKNNHDEHMFVNRNILETLVFSMKKYQKQKNFKIIFSSTISVYGESFRVSEYDENKPLYPLSPYAISKKKAEEFLLKNHKHNSWVLRFAPVYSSNFSLNIDRRTKLYDLYFRVGNGNSKLSLCNIKNIKESFRAILKGDVPSGIYNISDSKIYNYNDLLQYQKAKYILSIPNFFIYIIYLLTKRFNIVATKENAIKLLKDNIYPANKLMKYVNLDKELN
mgnify:CR=1 FL=1